MQRITPKYKIDNRGSAGNSGRARGKTDVQKEFLKGRSAGQVPEEDIPHGETSFVMAQRKKYSRSAWMD